MPTYPGRFGITLLLTSSQRSDTEPVEGELCQDPDTDVLYIGRSGVWTEHLPAIDAANAEYVPDDGGDWDAPPDSVESALDELASRATATEAAASGYVPKSDFTAKGQLFVATGSGAYAALAVGSNGQVLTADSTQSTGTKWATPSGGGGGGMDGRDTMPSDVTTTSSSHTIDPANGLAQRVQLAHNLSTVTLTEPSGASGESFFLTVDWMQGTGGSNLYTGPTSEAGWVNCEMPGGTAPVFATGINSLITKTVFQWNGRRSQYELVNVVPGL